ncbi:hypothetical protein M3568_19945, partial [Priestia flexa]|uniref:hypothetical protein n=1 Tax=Priestia flexa TaxID=86664 RepID=UPI00203B5593
VHRLQRKMCIDQSNRSTKKGSHHQNAMMRTLFHYFWLVMSQPRPFFNFLIISISNLKFIVIELAYIYLSLLCGVLNVIAYYSRKI